MMFLDYCRKTASNTKLVFDETDMNIPEKYIKKFEAVITNFRYKLKILDRVEFRYIEDATEKSKLDPNMDICEGVMNGLCDRLYNMKYHELDEDQQKIIKVLTTYIMI